MAALRVAAKAKEGRQHRRREIIAPSERPSQEDGHTPNPEVMATIRQFPPYLQPVVTLMANMVPPSNEDRLGDKKGKEVLAQFTNMIMVVSFISPLKFL